MRPSRYENPSGIYSGHTLNHSCSDRIARQSRLAVDAADLVVAVADTAVVVVVDVVGVVGVVDAAIVDAVVVAAVVVGQAPKGPTPPQICCPAFQHEHFSLG